MIYLLENDYDITTEYTRRPIIIQIILNIYGSD